MASRWPAPGGWTYNWFRTERDFRCKKQCSVADLKRARHGAEKLQSIYRRLSLKRDIECMHTIFDNEGAAYAVAHRRLDGQALVYTVHAGDHLELVARAVVDVARGCVSEVLVWPGWHQRGVAAALYRLIECERGKALRPSPARGLAGRAFWASRGIDLSA